MTQTPTAPTITTKTPVQRLDPSMVPNQPQYTITDKDKARVKRIQDAWKAYEGELDKPLEKMPGQPDDNVLSNRMQAVVDRGVDFLFGKELELSCNENTSNGDTQSDDGTPQEETVQQRAQNFLNDTWGRKETRIPLLQKLAMNGAMAGQAFLRIVPEPNGTFRLVTVDPATVYVKTAPQDCETALLYCIEYCTEQQTKEKISPEKIYYREEIARNDPDQDGDDGNPFADVDATWTIQHWSRIGDKGNWTPAGEPIAWPYPFPPIFSCQNLPKPNDPWGYPDITPDLIGLNASLNLVQSNINRSEKIYGNPIIYATGTGESVIDNKPGKIIGLPLSESKIVAVNIVTDVANALQFANNVRSDIDEQTGVPGVATGRIADLPRGNVSGIVIELLFMPLLKKTDKKRCLYGELIIDVSKALLILKGMSGDIDITLNWQNPLPSDDLQSVQAAVAKQQIGISNTTLQRELGYDPDEQSDLKVEEEQQQITNFSRGQGFPPAQPSPLGQAPATEPGQPMNDQQGGAQ